MVRGMPILRGSVTFARYRVERGEKSPSDARRWLLRGLKSAAFEPIDRKSEDDRAAGFAELENRDQTEFAPSNLIYGERALVTWRVDQLRVSASQLREELERWAQSFEREHDRKPSRTERTQARGALRQQARTRALPSTRTHDIAWNLKSGELQIWSASRKVVDEIVLAIETAFEVRLHARTPSAFVGDGDTQEPLRPTLALVGGTEEVAHGAA